MQQSKLITLFRCFSKEEIDRFEVFLSSPYFNQSEKLVKLFRLIEPHHPLFVSVKLEKERLYKVLHSKDGYNDATMRKLISEMFKLAKAFVAYEALNKDGLQTSVLRYKWFFENNLEKLSESELEIRKSLLDGYGQHDDNYYHHRWLYNLQNFEIVSDRVRGAEHKLLKDFDLFEHVHSLNRNYLINSFAVLNYLLALSRIYKFSMDEALLQQVETLARLYVNKGDKVIDIFFNVFQLTRTNEEKYFFELKHRFLENEQSVPRNIMMEVGVGLDNYCAKKLREGDEHFGAEVMQVYRFEVENNLYLSNGKMSYIYYFNVAVRGIETDEVDWVEHFVEKYAKELPDELREDAYNYGKAHVLFARRKYKEALRMALSCNLTFFLIKIILRNLIARIQYELGMWDELQNELDNHRHHLKDEKLTDERRKHLQTFIIVMRQLCELKRNYSHERLMQLSLLVEAQKGFANRKWFLEKIQELKSVPHRFERIKELSL